MWLFRKAPGVNHERVEITVDRAMLSALDQKDETIAALNRRVDDLVESNTRLHNDNNSLRAHESKVGALFAAMAKNQPALYRSIVEFAVRSGKPVPENVIA